MATENRNGKGPRYWRFFLSVLVLCLVTCSGFAGANQAQARNVEAGGDRADKMRSRLEQLFIWRVSDRLRLSTTEETRFTTEYRKLTEERQHVNQEIDKSLDRLQKARGNKAQLSEALAEYQRHLKKLNALQTQEMEVMGKILNSDRLAEYILLKRELTEKFRDAVAVAPTGVGNVAPTGGAASEKSQEPQVIQEK
jgi:hypothetical protein